MTQVVNQNHISDIIRQNIALTSEIVGIISDTTFTVSNIISLVDKFKATNDSIYGSDGSGGVMGQIVEINNNVVEHNKLKIMPGRDKLIEFHFEEILKIMKYMKKLGRNTFFMKDERIQRATTVINYLKDINDTLNSIKFNPMLSVNLEFLNQSIDKLNKDTIPCIRNISIKTLFISSKGLNKVTELVFPFINNVLDILKQYKFTQLFFLKKKLNMVGDIITSLEDVMDKLLSFSIKNFLKGIIGNQQFKLIRNIFDNLKSIIEFVDDMNMIDTTSRKFRLLSRYVTYIFRIAHKVVSRLQGKMYGVFNLIATVVKMRLFAVIFAELMMIVDYVQNSKTFLLKGKLKTLRSNLFRLFNIVFDLIIYTSLFKPIALIKCIIKLFLIKKIFQLLAGTIAFATLAALVSVPFLILAIPFIAAIIAMCYVIEILILYASTISVKDLLKLMLIISIILLISLIGLALVTLALVAKTVMKSYGWILLFILGLIPIVLLMLLLGYVTISLAFIAAPAVIGMFAMTVMITAVMLMALQLKLLEKIHLDRRAIMDTVDTIMDVANEIIYSLFASDDAQKDIDSAGKSKSWFGAFMGIFVSNKIMLQAILSAGIMALTFVSVTMILLIALELKLLQQETMKLDRDSILSSVDKVLGTARFINDCIFKGKYYDEGAGEIKTNYDHDQKTWLGKMFTGIGTILNTICSSAIMMMSFISISMIWLMAKELTSLQNIELNKDAIAANIEKIITTAKQVIDVVNAPSDTKEKNKDDGIIGKLLNFVLPSNMKYMIDAISTMGFTAITMIAIGIICKIGEQLTKIQELPKLDKVQSNTKVLMETCKAVIGIVEEQNFNIKELSKHIKAVRRIKNLVNNIADLINIEVKEDKLSSNISTLVTSANSIITSIDDININNINLDRIDEIAEMFRGIKKLINVTNGVTILTIDELGYTSFIKSVNNIMKELHPKRVGALKRNKFEHHINIFKDLNESIKHTNETVSPTDISNIVDNEDSYIKLIHLINNIAKELHPKRIGALKRNKFNNQLMVFGALTSYINKNYEDITNVVLKTFPSYKDSGYGQFIGLLRDSCNDIIRLIETKTPNTAIKYTNKLNNLLKEFLENNNKVDLNRLKETTNNYIKFLDEIAKMFGGIKKLINVANGVTVLTIDEFGYTSFIKSMNNIMKELHSKHISVSKRSDFEHHINIFKDLNESIKYVNETVSPMDISNIVDNEDSYIKLVNLINNIAKELHPKRVGSLKRDEFNNQLMVFGTLTSYVNKNYEDIVNMVSKTFPSYKDSGYGQFIGLLGDSCNDIIRLIETKTPNTAIKYANELNNLLGEFLENNNKVDLNRLKETTNNYIKFLDKIGSVKIDNLTKAVSIFKHMARFSESISGNFEKLSESINEDLMPVLEELKKIMEQVPEAVEKSSANISASVAANNNNQLSKSENVAQIQRENPNISESEAVKKALERTQQQAAKQADSVSAKLDKLISMLSNGSAKIKTSIW